MDIPTVKISPLRRSLPTELLVGGLTIAVEKRNCLIQTIRSHRMLSGIKAQRRRNALLVVILSYAEDDRSAVFN